MAWIGSTVNGSTDQKMQPTLNGGNLFLNGPFSIAYATSGYVIGASATGGVGDAEYSIFSGLSASSNANFLANTVSTASTPSVLGYVNLASDPTGKGPGSSLFLPGASQAQGMVNPYGSLIAGTWFSGRIFGKFKSTGTPTFQVRVHLRNPITGKIAYTICDTTAFTTVNVAADLGLKIVPSFVVTTGGSSGTIIGTIDINYGVNGYQSNPTITTVDCTQSYILDVSMKWGTAAVANTTTIYGALFDLVG